MARSAAQPQQPAYLKYANMNTSRWRRPGLIRLDFEISLAGKHNLRTEPVEQLAMLQLQLVLKCRWIRPTPSRIAPAAGASYCP